jgi:hypothetical protein
MADDILFAAFTPDRKGAVVSIRFTDLWRKAKPDRQRRILQSMIDAFRREDIRIKEEQAKLNADKGDKN